ncbi:hypothetical protein M5W68_18455 [Paenibacillus larvae]|uniref:hypothetical protein n=1 Tax=Paenibacillus larvae TaxID=1464 RepID=UPI00228057A8|nr:hypothetical protein [Paenibacillus larvae]MCY9527034.1 hypothetical protein [Paenibacillus larvae]
MKAYKVTKEDMMGFPLKVEYYLDVENAKTRFSHYIKEYLDSKYLANEDDCKEYQSHPIKINENPKSFNGTYKTLVEASVALWERISYEYNEWDIHIKNVRVDEINLLGGTADEK